jgi:LPS-assembly protein
MVSDENSTIIKKGIFTTCKQNESCPPWTIQSKEIEHDKINKNIIYKNAWLNFYDKPVLYFPKFFHPDPTVKRQSGFLIPSVLSSSNSGNSFNIPYFHVMAENKDFTLSPRIYFNNDFLIQNEYRQIEKNLNHITDISFKKLDNSSKSHFFSNTKISLDTSFENSDVEINLEKTSNDTYLKSENIKTALDNNQSVLNSYINYSINNDDLDFFAELAAYEDLSQAKNSDKYQFILPSFSFSKLLNLNRDIKGSLKYALKGLSQKKNTNISESYL